MSVEENMKLMKPLDDVNPFARTILMTAFAIKMIYFKNTPNRKL